MPDRRVVAAKAWDAGRSENCPPARSSQAAQWLREDTPGAEIEALWLPRLPDTPPESAVAVAGAPDPSEAGEAYHLAALDKALVLPSLPTAVPRAGVRRYRELPAWGLASEKQHALRRSPPRQTEALKLPPLGQLRDPYYCRWDYSTLRIPQKITKLHGHIRESPGNRKGAEPYWIFIPAMTRQVRLSLSLPSLRRTRSNT